MIFTADHLSILGMQLHDGADVFRVVNAFLAVVCATMMIVAKGSSWRTPNSTGRVLATGVAGLYLWQAYVSMEVVLSDPIGTRDAVVTNSDGLRVYGVTVFLVITLVGLIVQQRRAHKLGREGMMCG